MLALIAGLTSGSTGNKELRAPVSNGRSIVPESKPHSSLQTVAIESPECPKCQSPMMLSRIMPGRLKFDLRTFECAKCDHVEKVLVAIPFSPMCSDDLG